MDIKRLAALPPWDWPMDARVTVLELLKDESHDEDERLLAAELAGETSVIDDDIVEALLDILDRGDFSEELRSQAAVSLGPVLEEVDIDGFDEPGQAAISEASFRQIQEALQEVYADNAVPKVVRRRALEAAVRAPRDWQRGAIVAAYGRNDREWKLTAMFAARWVDGFEEMILEGLESDDEEIHYEAVCAAGNWGIDAAWPHVEPLLSRSNVDKRTLLAAIEAVGSIRPDDAVDILSELQNTADEDVAEMVHEVIALTDSDIIEIDD